MIGKKKFGEIRKKSGKNLEKVRKKSKYSEKNQQKNPEIKIIRKKKSGENPEKNSAEFSLVKFAKITYSVKRLKNGSKKCYYSCYTVTLPLIGFAYYRKRDVDVADIYHHICWMSSPKVASRHRSRLFKLADFQL